MAFDVNTITVQGAIAIASATAGNKLVIDGCDAVTSIYTQAQAVQIASRPATPDSTTTSIALAGSTENHVYAYASFIQGETGQPGGDVHSFLLYGHSENTPNVVVVVAVASSTDPVHLPEVGDVTNRTEVQFELSFSATDEVVTVAGTSMYTTRGEFLLLKNRTVTTHAEGETTVGDDQTIYGAKAFADGIQLAVLSGIEDEPVEFASSIEGNIVPSDDNDYTIGDSTHCYSNVYSASIHVDGISSKSPGAIELGNSMAPDTDGAFDLGSGEYNFRSVYTYALESHAMDGDEGGRLALAGVDPSSGSTSVATIDLIAKQSNSDEYPTFRLYLYNSYSGEDCELTFRDGFLVGDGANGACLGTASRTWDGYLYNLCVHRIEKFTSATHITTDSLAPSGNAAYLGLPQLPFANINATAFHGLDFLPLDNTADVGKSDNKFRRLYANELHGVIPHPTASNADPPVGSIVMLEVSDGASYNINVGDQIQGIANRSLKIAVWDAGAGKWGNRGSALGSSLVFRALSGGSPSSTHVNYVLAIRVQ